MRINKQYKNSNTLYSLIILAVTFTVSVVFMLSITIKHSKALEVNEIINQSNDERIKFNIKPLSVDEKLMSAAQTKAEDMAKNHYFSHNTPDGAAPWKFISDKGYNYSEAGENLAITNQSAKDIVDGWLNSPTHRDNLLNANYDTTGVGMATFGDYENYKNTTVVVAFYAKSDPRQVSADKTNKQPTHPAGELVIAKKPDTIIGKYLLMICVTISVIAILYVVIKATHKNKNKTKKLPRNKKN